jgi:hypothetical protein
MLLPVDIRHLHRPVIARTPGFDTSKGAIGAGEVTKCRVAG